MRGSSSGAMPAPVSRTRTTASLPSCAACSVHAPAGRRVLHRVVHEVGEHLPQAGAIDRHDEPVGDVGGQLRRHAPRRRPRTGPPSAGPVRPAAPARAAAPSCRSPPPRCPSACGASCRRDRLPPRTRPAPPACAARRRTRAPASAMPRRRVSGVRRSCATLSRAPRMPVTTRSMRSSIALTRPPSSPSASSGLRGRHPRVGAARAHDAAHRLGQVAHRLQARARDDGAASQGDDHHQREIDEQHAAEALQQLAAPLGALADLQQRAVGQPHRGHFQHVAAVAGVEFGPGLLAARAAACRVARGRSAATAAAC